MRKSEIFKENILKQLRPKTSWWSLVGIVVFFFVPEIIAFFWGERIMAYADFMQKHTDDYLMQKVYDTLEMFGENSLFNIILGVIFIVWFFHERRKC